MSYRIIAGKGGQGFAYVFGTEYPTEGFDTEQAARAAAEARAKGKPVAAMTEFKGILGTPVRIYTGERAQGLCCNFCSLRDPAHVLISSANPARTYSIAACANCAVDLLDALAEAVNQTLNEDEGFDEPELQPKPWERK